MDILIRESTAIVSTHFIHTWVQIFIAFLLLCFFIIHEIHKNWYTTNNNESTVYNGICMFGIDL